VAEGKPDVNASKVSRREYYPDDFSDADFTLSHYGLPEPVDNPASSPSLFPPYLWLLLIAGAVAVIAWRLRVAARRRSRGHDVGAPTPPTG